MRLVLFAFLPAIGLGYVLGGRLRHLSGIRFRHGWAGLAGVALQFLPFGGTAGHVALLASFALLLFVAAVNLRLPGFPLVIVGLCLNFLVIGVNQGMPVTREAIVSSGQAETLPSLVRGGGTKHHLATEEDRLLFLGDVIGIPAPVRQAVSVGDILAFGGAMWLVVAGMRRPHDLRAPDPAPAAEVPG
jgi:hypothetical protein